MKIKLSGLRSGDDGLLLHRGSPFTGVAYDVNDDGHIAKCLNVVYGKTLEPHRHWGGGLPLFDSAKIHQEIDDPVVYVEGRPYSGILCQFFEELLVNETYIQDGPALDDGNLTCTSRRFYHNGVIEEIHRGGINESDSWWENGFKKAHETCQLRDGLRIGYDTDGNVT